MLFVAWMFYSAIILIFRFNIPKKYRKYVKMLKNINRYFPLFHDGRRIKRIPCKMRPRMKRRRKLQLILRRDFALIINSSPIVHHHLLSIDF
ncbi:regulatory protein blaR1 [Trichinella spiralis]|uniref:regulatory protein blaR1 n=1 Tax=Trichinella spiralis TaxID=6334 RepID=UPI0001EFD701|nr:regulatory protein blaR1 [Trichinella spiralis]